MRRMPIPDFETLTYEETDDGRILCHKCKGDGSLETVELCNFHARITEVLVWDDGAETFKVYRIEACVAGTRREIEVPAARFSSLGWVEAHPSVVDAIERVQQCSILCPDTLSQMTMARYLQTAIPSGALRRYIEYANTLYKKAADLTIAAIDRHLQRPRLIPAGGLYSVVDIGTNAEEFVPRALKATGVLVVPGAGFGASLTNGVRISFGPLVRDTAKIEEGLSRLGAWMRK